MHKDQKDARKATEILKFFDWAYRKGGDAAVGLDYVPMPETVTFLVEQMWTDTLRAGDKPVWPAAAVPAT
jgi:phosphate transport system substrate-binding protein